MTRPRHYDGSRRHVLDWLDSPGFLHTVQEWVAPQRLTIAPDAVCMPKHSRDPRESRLFDAGSPFLDDVQKNEFRRWWLAYEGNIPNWDVIIQATSPQGPALVLVEAKAHIGEFDRKSKPPGRRANPSSQSKSENNHAQIQRAISGASSALARIHPEISISCDRHYQLSNRIAIAWKLASLGVPNALVFLGFLGDREISTEGRYFSDHGHWQLAFTDYIEGAFPSRLLEMDIHSGATSFRLLSKSLPVCRTSRPIDERRASRWKSSDAD